MFDGFGIFGVKYKYSEVIDMMILIFLLVFYLPIEYGLCTLLYVGEGMGRSKLRKKDVIFIFFGAILPITTFYYIIKLVKKAIKSYNSLPSAKNKGLISIKDYEWKNDYKKALLEMENKI